MVIKQILPSYNLKSSINHTIAYLGAYLVGESFFCPRSTNMEKLCIVDVRALKCQRQKNIIICAIFIINILRHRDSLCNKYFT